MKKVYIMGGKILINRDGLVIYDLYPKPYKQGSFRLSAREIDEISDLLYKSNPRGFCEFENGCVEDGFDEQLFVDGHLFMKCYERPCIFINSYQRLIEYILEVCKENGLVEDL